MSSGLLIPGTAERANQFRMPRDERIDIFLFGRFADEMSDVERVEVARRDKAIHRVQIDVIRIDIIGLLPAQFLDGSVCGGTHAVGFRTDDHVLTVGLVPDRNDFNARFRSQLAGPQLRLGLVCKPVSDAECIFFNFQHNNPTVHYIP